MENPRSIAVTFLEHAPVHIAVPGNAAEFESLLHRAWETGRKPWPQVALSPDAFMRHLAERLPETRGKSSLAPLLEQMALADLYLACACMHRAPAALETLERHFLAKLPGALAYLKQPTTMIDDVCQTVRIQLLLGTSRSGPQLARYTGRGGLFIWIRVIAVRTALKQAAPLQAAPEANLHAVLEALPTPGPGTELDLIKRRYRREFRQAMHEAFAALPSEQRHLLRLHFIDRLSTIELGALFRVNQSTASRRLKSARQAVYEETRRRLQERIGLSLDEFESLLTAINSQLDLSLSQL